MKKTCLILSIILLVSLLLTACGPLPDSPFRNKDMPAMSVTDEPAAPTPAPTPEPVGMQKVFGKDVSIGLWGEDAAFLAGAKWQAEALGLPFAEAADADIIVAAYPDDDAFSGAPVVCLTDDSGIAEQAAASILYDPAFEAEAALELILEFPSHEAPVRLLGLFTAESSVGAAAYAQMQAEGKLYSRGMYYEGQEQPLDSWLDETLASIPAGLLDTIYTETPELARAAFEALVRAERNDVVEVITAGMTADIADAMLTDSYLMGAGVGCNGYAAGALSVRMAASLLAGETVEDVTLSHSAFLAEEWEVSLLGGADPVFTAVQLDAGVFEQYQGEAVTYLTEYTAQTMKELQDANAFDPTDH